MSAVILRRTQALLAKHLPPLTRCAPPTHPAEPAASNVHQHSVGGGGMCKGGGVVLLSSKTLGRKLGWVRLHIIMHYNAVTAERTVV